MFVVFDLDGTLADCRHRLHHIRDGNKNWDAFYEDCYRDTPNWGVIHAFHALRAAGHHLEIWTGRSEAVKDKTWEWLLQYRLHNVPLKMRLVDDYTMDHLMKEKWLKEASPRPDLVFEDSPRVIEMWRRNGVDCLHMQFWETYAEEANAENQGVS